MNLLLVDANELVEDRARGPAISIVRIADRRARHMRTILGAPEERHEKAPSGKVAS